MRPLKGARGYKKLTEKRRRRMRHVWIRNYRCISQCVEQTADRVHGVADPSFSPAVVQHRGLLVGTACAGAAAVSAVGALWVPVTGRTVTATNAVHGDPAAATAAAHRATGHEAAGRAGRRMIVVVRAIAIAPGRSAHVGPGSVRERGAPVTGTTGAAAGRVTGPRVVITAPRQAARGGRDRRRGRWAAAGRRRRGQAVIAAAHHGARHAPRRARPRL